MAPTPYLTLDRADWARLRSHTPLPLSAEELADIRGLGERVDLREVEDVYLPLSRLLSLYVSGSSALRASTGGFLATNSPRTPFVIGISGSVAVGKSTTSRILQVLLGRWPEHPHVDLVTTDGFLWPNAELEARGLMLRKGFPESYDRRALLQFVVDVKSGEPYVSAPVYDHVTYDRLPGEQVVVDSPDILIVEGLNVLAPPLQRGDGTYGPAVSDYFDFSVYVDADTADVRRWYVERFLTLRRTSFRDPRSYFTRYAGLSDAEATARAEHLWDTINGPNLARNIAPTRERATVILHKGADHAVQQVRLRKL